MAEAQKLDVRPRAVLGKKVSRLRRAGTLPGVIFGGHADSIPVEIDAHAFELGYRRWGNTTLMSLAGLDGGEVPALIHGVSREPRTSRMLHVDFARVSLTDKTRAEVPLHFAGEAPAVKTGGAILIHGLERVRVEAFPQDIPHRIEVDLTKLEQLEDALYIRDLVVDATTVLILNDGDELVAKAVAARVEEVVAAPTVEAAEGAEGAEAATAEGAEKPEGTAGAKPAAGAKPTAGAKPAAKPAAKT